MEMRKVSWSVVSLAAIVLLALAAAPSALAKDGDVLRQGACTGVSTSKIKLSEGNGRIEVEFEVDQNRNGVRWNILIRQNGRRVASLVRVTRGPSGSFEVRIVAPQPCGHRHVRRDRDAVWRDLPSAGFRVFLGASQLLHSTAERLAAREHGLEQVLAVPFDPLERLAHPKRRGVTSSVSSSQRSGVETGAPGFGGTE